MTLFSVLDAAGCDWNGTALTCHFSAEADGAPLPVVDDTKPVWTLPATATTVTITATPTQPKYWPTTVTLNVSNTGALTPAGPKAAFVTITALNAAGVVLTFAKVVLSRFNDVSDQVLGLMANPPAGLAQSDPPKTRAQIYAATYGQWPPQDWDLDDKPDAHFLDLPVPAQGVNFSTDPSVHVEADNVVLELAGVVAPKLWGVSWPADGSLDRNENAAPTPILLFLRQGNLQYDIDYIKKQGWDPNDARFSGAGMDPYPYNFDYATFGLYDDLAYPAVDVFNNPGSKGVPYQVAKAGAKAVTVHPVDSLKEDFGVIESAKQIGRILLELQAFMFMRAGVSKPPLTLGKTAIASFSSGTHILARILARPDNTAEPFLTDTVSAVYFLDAPGWAVNDCVVAAKAWAGAPARDKRVRFYTQGANHAGDLTGPFAPLNTLLSSPLPKEPFVATENGRTLGLVSQQSWQALLKTAGLVLADKFAWGYVHHATAATMLVHALAQGDLT